MAFPTVGATSSGNSGANATAHTVTLPTGISAGDLLIVVFVHDDAGGTVTSSVTTPASGWTASVDELVCNSAGTAARLNVFTRIADGTEGTTITITTSGSEGSAYAAYRISAGTWEGTTSGFEIATHNTSASSAAPNSPNLDPAGWGTEDTLWISAYGWDGNNSHSTYPTNYASNQLTNRWANAGGAGVAMASRELNAASEDPGAGAISGSDQWAAVTIAVRAATTTTVSPGLQTIALSTPAPKINLGVAPDLQTIALSTPAPSVNLVVAPPLQTIALSTPAPQVNLKVEPPLQTITLTPLAPANIGAPPVFPDLLTITLSAPAPQINLGVAPPLQTIALSTPAPSVNLGVAPGLQTIVLSAPAPQVNLGVAPPLQTLVLSTPVPTITTVGVNVEPPLLTLTLTPLAPQVNLGVAPPLITLALSAPAPQVNLGVAPPLLTLTLTPLAPTITGVQQVLPPLLTITLTPHAPSITGASLASSRSRIRDIQMHALVFTPDANGGPGSPKLELDGDMFNVTWQQAMNYPGQAAFTLLRFNPKLSQIDYMKDHIKIIREDSRATKTVFSGKLVKPQEGTQDSVIFAWDYAAFLQRSRTGFRVLYPEKTIKEIVDAEWALAKNVDKSPFTFVSTGTTETPLGLDGTTPIKTNSQFGVVDFDRLFLFFALAELSMANTDNNVVFEITREAPHTFNFWKNRSTNITKYAFTYPGNLIDYDLVDGHDQIVNDLATVIIDPTTGAQVEYALTDTASKDEYRRLQAATAIKTLYGISSGTTETDQQKAALARMLSVSVGIPSLYTLFPRQGEITPFDGWDLGDKVRVTLMKPDRSGDQVDAYKRITGIAGAWTPEAGELLQLFVR